MLQIPHRSAQTARVTEALRAVRNRMMARKLHQRITQQLTWVKMRQMERQEERKMQRYMTLPMCNCWAICRQTGIQPSCGLQSRSA